PDRKHTGEMTEAAGRVADSTGNWVDGVAPGWSRPYLRLARLDRPIGSWLPLVPLWGAAGGGARARAPPARGPPPICAPPPPTARPAGGCCCCRAGGRGGWPRSPPANRSTFGW